MLQTLRRHFSPEGLTLIALLGLVLVLLVTTGCGGTKVPPSLTPIGQAAWKAEKVLMAFEGIQDAAIGLNKIQRCVEPAGCAPLFSTENTRTVIRVTRIATDTIEVSPLGYRRAAEEALAALQKELDSSGKTEMTAWLLVVRTLLLEP
jgi:hypothetical protein